MDISDCEKVQAGNVHLHERKWLALDIGQPNKRHGYIPGMRTSKRCANDIIVDIRDVRK